MSTLPLKRLRIAGFAATALGGALVALGSLMPWVTVGLKVPGALDSTWRGTDVVEGTVALGMGIVVLVGVVAMRLTRSLSARRALGAAIIAGGLIAAGIAIADGVRADSRFEARAVDRVAPALAKSSGRPVAQERAELLTNYDKLERVTVEGGVSVVVAGGALSAIGGLLGLTWASRRARIPDAARPDEPEVAASPT